MPFPNPGKNIVVINKGTIPWEIRVVVIAILVGLIAIMIWWIRRRNQPVDRN
jgi:hypothetical protein